MTTHDASVRGGVIASDAGACPADKIAFAQGKACVNDGSVEFCLNSNDAATRSAVSTIAPEAKFVSGSSGRARCDRTSQTLVMVPVSKERDCPSTLPAGSSTNEAWSRICALASLASVKKIVPTFYE